MRRRFTLLASLLALLAVCLPAAADRAVREADALEVYRLINERLAYMEDVALYKAQSNLPVEDVERERVVIDRALESAALHGLDPESVRAFFGAQISVAKAIQYRRRADLLSTPDAGQPRDLATEVRPALLRLGTLIIEGLAGYCEAHGRFDPADAERFGRSITLRYVTAADKQLLYAALLQVELP